jgi:hypothetical protein
MDRTEEKETEEATWTQVGEYFQEIVDRLERQQQEKVERLRQALEEVE